MGLLIQLVKDSPPDDLKAVAKRLQPYLPKQSKPEKPHWVTLDEFRKCTPGPKPKAWIQLHILHDFPETRAWSTDPNPGRGGTVMVLMPQARNWIVKHNKEIDWNQKL